MRTLFEKQDWMKASSEEVASFVKKLSSIQENYDSLLALISRSQRIGMGRKGQDRYDEVRKPRTKRPVRKYNDQKVGHVRGYKEVG